MDRGRRPLPRHPLHHRLASRPGGLGIGNHPARGSADGLQGARRLRAPLGLSFDAWMYHTQLGELIDLACGFPETPIGLDHVGRAIGLGPYAGKRDEVFAAWSGQIRELAACPTPTSI